MDASTEHKTVLSAGLAVVAMLESSKRVTDIVGSQIFPVYIDREVTAPYIVYRRSSLESEQVKTGRPADCAMIDIWCYAPTYGAGIEMAEAVREALDGRAGTAGGIRVRRCLLTDASEDAIDPDGVMVQMLKFEIRI